MTLLMVGVVRVVWTVGLTCAHQSTRTSVLGSNIGVSMDVRTWEHLLFSTDYRRSPMGDKRVYNWKTPHNRYPMGYEYMMRAWNDAHPDDQMDSRQTMEHAVKRAEFSFVLALSNDPLIRDIIEATVPLPNATDQQRKLTRIVGLSEGMPESWNEFKRNQF